MTSKKKKIKEEEELETKKVQDDDDDDEKGSGDNKVNLQFIPFGNPEDDEIINKVMFYGPVNEKTSADFIANLITLHDRLDEGEEIEVYLSTSGGNTDDMFAIIDLMNIIKKERDIKIICIGKTMSAGVLLACSGGTKKKRFSTKNTRFMIHEVVFDSGGGSTTYNNHEFNEARYIQQMYIKSIAENTKLTEKKILKMIEGGHHHYFTAEEAKRYGVIDEIIGE